MKPFDFEKTMTRDNCLIIQEIWDKGYEFDYFGNKNPYLPTHINYVNNGVVEIWENKKAIAWFCNQLHKKYLEDKKFINNIIDEYKKTENRFKKLLKNKKLSKLEELNIFLKELDKGNIVFLAYYHLLKNKKIDKNTKDKLNKIRKDDAFYDIADKIIKNSIEKIFPHTKNLSISILENELNAPPDKNILQKRFKNCVHINNRKLIIDNLKNFSLNNEKYNFNFTLVPKNKLLKGQIAQKGKVKGVIRILKRKNQIKNFKKDEILVSPMTTPDFVPAMKKASAIITDEGGITCHAAILSRELKTPCIIGTKVATQFFKDGDLVEVDANKGVIKIL